MASAPELVAGRRRPKLVFLHGWTMDGSLFAGQCRRLAPFFDCASLDLPGHGTRRDAADLGIEAAADAVVAELPRADSGAVVLVGWSLGAMVAWYLLARHRDVPVAGLIAVDMSPRLLCDKDWGLGIRGYDAARNEKAMASMARDWRGYADRINAGMYARTDTARYSETLARIRSNRPETMLGVWRGLVAADAREVIGRIACPMLVIHGAQSRLYSPETAAWLVRNAPRAAAVAFERSGHSPHLEEPERFAQTILAFAREIGSQGQPVATAGSRRSEDAELP